MAQRQLLKAIAALAATARSVVATQVSLSARVDAKECWDVQLSSEQTFYPSKFQAHSSSDMADLFEIIYADTFKVIVSKLAKEQYVLTQCGQNQPTDAEVETVAALGTDYVRKHFSVPIQSAMAMSTVQLGFMDALGVQDRVSFVGGYASGPCWQKALGCGAAIEDSWAADFNATHLAWQKGSVDVVFVDCGSDCSSVNSMANGVHVPTTQEDGALANAEYIKYIGAFFNKEPEANDLFAATKLAYNQAASGAADPKPVVAWLSYSTYGGPNSNEPAFVVSQAAYKMGLVTDAGGVNFDAAAELAALPGFSVKDAVWGNPAAGKTYSVVLSAYNGSDSNTMEDVKANASAHVMPALGSVDIVIDENYAYDPSAYTYESFLTSFGLTNSSNLTFVKNQMVLRLDRTISAGNGLDWFESRIAKPDWALEGLAYAMHEDQSKRAKYFRNVAKGETPDQVLTAEMCKATLPVCEAEAVAEAIAIEGPTTVNSTTVKSTTEKSTTEKSTTEESTTVKSTTETPDDTDAPDDKDVSGTHSFVLPTVGLAAAVAAAALAGSA